MKKMVVLVLVTNLLVGCSPKNKEVEELESVSIGPAVFEQKVKETPEAVILDVRTAEEFQSGNIANSINLDFNNPDFKKVMEQQDKEKPYLVYCAKGSRSGQAAELMRGLGFKEVYHLDGGLNAWKAAGLPLDSIR